MKPLARATAKARHARANRTNKPAFMEHDEQVLFVASSRWRKVFASAAGGLKGQEAKLGKSTHSLLYVMVATSNNSLLVFCPCSIHTCINICALPCSVVAFGNDKRWPCFCCCCF